MRSTMFTIKGIRREISSDPNVAHTQAVLLYKLGKTEAAIKKYEEAASEGNIKSQYALGTIFEDMGELEEAERWYKIAYKSGKDELEEAERWYKIAYKSGKDEAALDIGNIKFSEEDYQYALYWYDKAVEIGLLAARNNMGVTYYVLKNYEKAEAVLLDAF